MKKQMAMLSYLAQAFKSFGHYQQEEGPELASFRSALENFQNKASMLATPSKTVRAASRDPLEKGGMNGPTEGFFGAAGRSYDTQEEVA